MDYQQVPVRRHGADVPLHDVRGLSPPPPAAL